MGVFFSLAYSWSNKTRFVKGLSTGKRNTTTCTETVGYAVAKHGQANRASAAIKVVANTVEEMKYASWVFKTLL